MRVCVPVRAGGRGILRGRVMHKWDFYFFFLNSKQTSGRSFSKSLAGNVKTTLLCVAPPSLTWPPLCPLRGWLPVYMNHRATQPGTSPSRRASQKEPRPASVPRTLHSTAATGPRCQLSSCCLWPVCCGVGGPGQPSSAKPTTGVGDASTPSLWPAPVSPAAPSRARR